MERPFEEVFETGEPDFPFMLCWANENWTRRWDGNESEVLIRQYHSDQDDIDHVRSLIRYFKDTRYIKVNNKPVFIIYKPHLFKDITKTVENFRIEASKFGIELYLCHMVFKNQEKNVIKGFDACIDFEPWGTRRDYSFDKNGTFKANIFYKILKRVKRQNKAPTFYIKDYEAYFSNLEPVNQIGMKIFPTVVPSWDNSARKGANQSFILVNSTPEKFERLIKNVLSTYVPYSNEENFLFINAWNEWGEGNHLEPDRLWGLEYLEALKRALG